MARLRQKIFFSPVDFFFINSIFDVREDLLFSFLYVTRQSQIISLTLESPLHSQRSRDAISQFIGHRAGKKCWILKDPYIAQTIPSTD